MLPQFIEERNWVEFSDGWVDNAQHSNDKVKDWRWGEENVLIIKGSLLNKGKKYVCP